MIRRKSRRAAIALSCIIQLFVRRADPVVAEEGAASDRSWGPLILWPHRPHTRMLGWNPRSGREMTWTDIGQA
jgi:hypothetical protein